MQHRRQTPRETPTPCHRSWSARAQRRAPSTPTFRPLSATTSKCGLPPISSFSLWCPSAFAWPLSRRSQSAGIPTSHSRPRRARAPSPQRRPPPSIMVALGPMLPRAFWCGGRPLVLRRCTGRWNSIMYRLRCAQGARQRAPSRDTPRLQRPGPSRAIGIFHSTPSVSSKCDDTNVLRSIFMRPTGQDLLLLARAWGGRCGTSARPGGRSGCWLSHCPPAPLALRGRESFSRV